MKNRSSTYLRRLVSFYVLLSTLPVLILGVFSYWKSSDIIQQKVNKSNLQVLYQTQMAVEENLKLIHNYYTLFAYSQETNNLINQPLDYKDMDSILWAQEELQGLMKIHTTVKNAYLINPDEGWFISNESAGELNEIVNKEQLLDMINTPRNIYWTYVATKENEEDTSSSYIDVGNISMVIRFPFNQELPKAGIIVSLSQYQFNKSISSAEKAERLLILDENNRVIYDDDASMIGTNLDQYEFSGSMGENKEPQGFFKATMDGQRVGVNYTRSTYNGWTYLSLYSISQITEDSRAIGWVTFLLCIGLMGLSLSISAFGSTKMIYNPVKNIYESVRKEISFNENHSDEMKCIDEGINTLITSRNAMEQQIKAQLQQVEELFLIRLINGEMQRKEMELKLKSLGVAMDWNILSVLSVEIDTIDQDGEVAERQDMIMLGINRIMEEVIGDKIFLKPIFAKQVQTVLVKGQQEQEEKFNHVMYDYAELVQKMIKERLNITISIGISRPYEDIMNTQIAYKESLEALRCRIGFGEQVILFFHEVQPGQYIRQSYPKNTENELIHAINMGDEEKAESLLDNLVDQIVKEQLSFNEYQVYFTRLLIEIIRVIQDSGESLNSLFQDNHNVFEELNGLTNAEDMKYWFKTVIIHPIITIREERSENTHKQILDDVLRIIEEEYDTDLSLEECASRLNYHPSYIWRIMRKEMDTSFSEYIAQYRLKIAKRWLEETEMPILEIAEKLKYNNSQNFIRYFKKLEGTTPGKYRKEIRQKYKA